VGRSYTHTHRARERVVKNFCLFVLFVCLPVSWSWDRGEIGLLFFVFL
jgi:hypothetical protein